MNATISEAMWFMLIGFLIGYLFSNSQWLDWLVKQYMDREKRLKKMKIKEKTK